MSLQSCVENTLHFCFQYGHISARTCSQQNGWSLSGSADIYCKKQQRSNQSNCLGPRYVFLMSLVAEGLIQCLHYLHRTPLSVKGLIIYSVFVSISFSLATLKFSVGFFIFIACFLFSDIIMEPIKVFSFYIWSRKDFAGYKSHITANASKWI